MANYTQLNQQDIQKIAAHYELAVTEFEPMDGGNGNSSFLLKTQHCRYVLTVCDDKTFDEVMKLGQLLQLLEKHDIPCTRLISPVSSNILTTYLDKPVMLKAYITGEVIETLTETMLFQVGRQTAKLAQIPVPDYLPNHHPYGRQFFAKIKGLNIDQEYQEWLARELDYLDANISDDLPKGLIHGDLYYDNLLFEHGAFKAIIDFEEACNYYYVFELGMAILGCCIDGTSINIDKASALVHGYQQIRPLTAIEKESLQMFVRYAATATSYWRFNKFNIEMPTKEKDNHHWQLVQIAKEVSAIAPSKFLQGVFN